MASSEDAGGEDFRLIKVPILVVIVSLATYVFWSLSKPKQPLPRSKYPPGPPGKPLVGNLLDIPPKHSWLQFKKWADQYGPLMRLNLAGNEHYIISTEKVANDLLRERGSTYSSRAQAPASAVLLSDNLRPVLLPYNDVWRNGRKFMHQVANANVANQYHSTQELESTRTLRDLIREPAKYEHWFERYAAAIVFRLAFGKRIKTGDEEIVQKIVAVNHNLERIASPGAYLVDTFPSLMYLPRPLAPFKWELEELHRREHSLFRGLMEEVRERMRDGTAPKCWERDFLESQADLNLTDDQGAYVVGTMFEAGSGTTSAAMMSFMLCMVLHPAWFAKLQNEVDKVCGSGRLPYLDDTAQLPTVRAVTKETLRWRPVTGGGLPHMNTKDDVYDGMFIPAGTVVHPNQWAIHRQPELYPEPDEFRPERWLEPGWPTYKEPLSTYPNLHNYSNFGFGRRICPGQNIAERNLYLLVSRIAWACDISKSKDPKTGQEIVPPLYDYTAGFNSQPKWFPFELNVRSSERLSVIDAELEREARSDPLKSS